MTTRYVIRAGALALGVAAGSAPLSAQQHRGGGHGQGGGQRGGTAPAVGTVRAGAPQGGGGGVLVGVRVQRRAAFPGSSLNPAPGFGGTLGQGVAFNLGRGLVVPVGGEYRGGGRRAHVHAGGPEVTRRWHHFGSPTVVVPYQSPYVYVPSVYVVEAGQGWVPDETPAAPEYYAPAGILLKPPASFEPSAEEGYPMGRYPVVIRRALRTAADSAAARATAARAAAERAAPAAGGFVVEELMGGVVRVRWPDDGRGAREVTLFTADRAGQRMAWQTLRAAPYTGLFDVTRHPIMLGVTIVRPDGTTVTTSVPYTPR